MLVKFNVIQLKMEIYTLYMNCYGFYCEISMELAAFIRNLFEIDWKCQKLAEESVKPVNLCFNFAFSASIIY